MGSNFKIGKVFSSLIKEYASCISRGYFVNLKKEYKADDKAEKLLETERMTENIESIVNIMFIPAGLNKRINYTDQEFILMSLRSYPTLKKFSIAT